MPKASTLVLTCSIFLCLCTTTIAQTSDTWTLQRAIQYAMDNNLSVQQSVLNTRLARLRNTQTQLSQLPNINGGAYYGKNYGRSVNPVTNQFVESNYNYATLTGNADVLLFGWFQKRNLVSQGKLIQKAAEADLDQTRNDISLNLATAFLRTVLAKEQVDLGQKQITISRRQLDQTRMIVNSGVLPQLEVAQLESQIASDSAKLMKAVAAYNSSLLDIKALLNLDMAAPLDISITDTGIHNYAQLINTEPETIFNTARQQMGNIRSSNYRVAAAEKFYQASRGAMLPQLGLIAQWGTNYSSLSRQLTTAGYTNTQIAGSYVDVNGNQYPIYQLAPVYTTSDISFGDQFSNNARSNIAVSLTLPIFNGWRISSASREAKIMMESERINRRATEQEVKQGVYNAYNEAKSSLQQYYAAQKAETAARTAFDYISQRYSVGLDNTINYLILQNKLFDASFATLSAKYDLVLKLKILDYYMGRPLSL